MAVMIWVGVVLTAAGLCALIWCIAVAARAKSAGLEGAAMEARLRRLVAVNLGALAASALGLMLIAAGAILG